MNPLFRPVESIKPPHKLLAFCDKYAFDSIVKKILTVLSQTFPDTMEAWNRPRDDDQIKEALNVTIAASRLGMKIFIPSCLYTIMSSSIYESDLHKLPRPLLLQYHHGFAHFSTYAINFYETTLKGRSTPPRGCHKKARCRDAWSDLRSSVEQTFLRDSAYIRYPKPLEFLQRLSDMVVSKSTYEDYCTKCQVSLSGVLRDTQRDVWDSLPRIFKVTDSWEELRPKDA